MKKLWVILIFGIVFLIIAVPLSYFKIVDSIVWAFLLIGGGFVFGGVKLVKSLKLNSSSSSSKKMNWYDVSRRVNELLRKHPKREMLDMANIDTTKIKKWYETDPADLSKWPLYSFTAPGVESRTRKLVIYSERDDDIVNFETDPTEDMMTNPWDYFSLFKTQRGLEGVGRMEQERKRFEGEEKELKLLVREEKKAEKEELKSRKKLRRYGEEE